MSADVVVRFLGDVSDLNKSVSQVEGTGNRLTSWAKGVGAAIGGAVVLDQLKQATDAAAAFADTVAASGAIFDSSARAVTNWVNNNALAFNISKTQAQEAANTFGIFGKAAGLSGKDLSGFSTDLVGLAGDLRSFYGGNVEEAITAIGAALRGESEPIRKYGVLLDDATLKARATAMGIYEGTAPLTAQQKVLATNAELWAQTSDAQGDAAKTADSAANQQAKLAAQTENARVAIGTALLPAMQALLPIITMSAKMLEKLAPVLPEIAAGVGILVAALKIWQATQIGLNATLMANPIGLIVAALAALVLVIMVVVKHWDTIKAAAEAAWNAILDAVRFVWNWIKDNWPLILAVLTGPFGVAVALIVKNWDTIKEAAEKAFDAILDVVSMVWDWIKEHWPQLVAILTGPFGIAVYLIVSNWSTITGFFSGIIDAIGGIVGKVTNLLFAPFKYAKDLILGLFDEIKGAANTVLGAIGFAKGAYNDFRNVWNSIELKVPKVDLGPFGSIGGNTIGLPNIPKLAQGGIVSGPTLALIGERGREAVVPLPRGASLGGNATYNLNVHVAPGSSPAAVGAAIVDSIRKYERVNGRSWRS